MTALIWPLVGSLLRNGITAFGAYLGTYGLTVSGEMQDKLVGAAMVLVALGWSGVQKWWAQRAARAGAVAAAVASVEVGRPVTVTVTPDDRPNVATLIPAAEANKAPAVPVGVPPQPAPVTP
jgi:hypothetical protein